MKTVIIIATVADETDKYELATDLEGAKGLHDVTVYGSVADFAADSVDLDGEFAHDGRLSVWRNR